MEIQLEGTRESGWKMLAEQTKATQITMESVVPDTRDDIGRILSVRPEICLKSKEVNGSSAEIKGETSVSLLYINEEESAVSSIQMSKTFYLSFDLQSDDPGLSVQIQLSLNNLQSRILNPRKVSVDLEIEGRLSTAEKTEYLVLQQIPEENTAQLHVLESETDFSAPVEICEKNVTINQQLYFPYSAFTPGEVLAKDCSFRVNSREIVGSRLLVKGDLELQVYCLPEDRSVPFCQGFTVPFSQLVDLGTERADRAFVHVEPISTYLELNESIEGQKYLDFEAHALVQVCSMMTLHARFVADVYSNILPCRIQTEETDLLDSVRENLCSYQSEETIELPSEDSELLIPFLTLFRFANGQGSAVAELLCRSKDGKLYSIRRTLSFTCTEDGDDHTFSSCTAEKTDCRLDGDRLTMTSQVKKYGIQFINKIISYTGSVELDEEEPFDRSCYPAMTAVWAEAESVWELAKLYHSSPEAILACNGDLKEKPLLIPKEL